MKTIYVLLSSFVLISCTSNPKAQDNSKKDSHDTAVVLVYPMNMKELTELKNEAMSTGNVAKYLEAKKSYFDNMQWDQFLYCSLMMANKYNYNIAHYDVYFALTHPHSGEVFKELDKITQNLALYYLLRAYELGYKDAIYDIKEIIGENKPIPSSSYYFNPKDLH